MDSRTVREYFRILADTLLGAFVEPFSRHRSRAVITRAPKFHLFDVGVAGHVTGRRIERAAGPDFGRALEHFILMELLAWRAYRECDVPVRFWRTKSGLECDFVLGRDGAAAIEVKGSARVRREDLTAMRAYVEEHRPRRAIVVCNEEEPRRHRRRDPGVAVAAVSGAALGRRSRRMTTARHPVAGAPPGWRRSPPPCERTRPVPAARVGNRGPGTGAGIPPHRAHRGSPAGRSRGVRPMRLASSVMETRPGIGGPDDAPTGPRGRTASSTERPAVAPSRGRAGPFHADRLAAGHRCPFRERRVLQTRASSPASKRRRSCCPSAGGMPAFPGCPGQAPLRFDRTGFARANRYRSVKRPCGSGRLRGGDR